MGMYDTVYDPITGREGQVKCWRCELQAFTFGRAVMPRTPPTYSVLMQDYDGGGYLNVTENVLLSWTDVPEHQYVIDKWGSPVHTE